MRGSRTTAWPAPRVVEVWVEASVQAQAQAQARAPERARVPVQQRRLARASATSATRRHHRIPLRRRKPPGIPRGRAHRSAAQQNLLNLTGMDEYRLLPLNGQAVIRL